ncbi:hypothetical protein F5X68DRAFT_178041 [Plectosphaerella plurivora]|uniref:Zn(2)-C6 fungal-type domain-containing protein n=1 Tax=Plectosphaerella plurivora TaxID=936078 RepID=A0A9P8V142_9PEZI|nr:hypothetical protein F5X68DRAFT_178041 [Plectosphaerella plurivora]
MNPWPPLRNSGSGSQLPSRRRVWQACSNCRARKTRCDAATPRCSLCATQDVECVYADAPQPRIEYNTWLLLDRIQALEDRLLSSPNFSAPTESAATAPPAPPVLSSVDVSHPATATPSKPPTTEIPISSSHTANANHVINWPIVQELLASVLQQTEDGKLPNEATAVFFSEASQRTDGPLPDTWRLFEGPESRQAKMETFEGCLSLIQSYFDEFNVFYPLLSYPHIVNTLRVVADDQPSDDGPPPADYCILLQVLAMGSFVNQGLNRVTSTHPLGTRQSSSPHRYLWLKAKMLLGHIAPETTIEAAQCTMLASIYMGAQGRVPEAFHWSHVTSGKCAALINRFSHASQDLAALPEPTRRLFWIAFIYEGDFMSEISIILPSGIARYEDQVPYPTRSASNAQVSAEETPRESDNTSEIAPQTEDEREELIAFQISTNAAIRRLLNRVHSMVYDSKDQFRLTSVEYISWLLRVAEDFWSYHESIYNNIPHFLFQSKPQEPLQPLFAPGEPQSPQSSRTHGLSNNPWNVLRLKGRYEAAKHIIHRPFFDYVLLNMGHVQTHPDREVILQKCGLCLLGCAGFISVFDVEALNSVTCLFATGMATFTYLVILRVATIYPIFRHVLPDHVEDVIAAGKRNMRRFSLSIGEFGWHLDLLGNLDVACNQYNANRMK